MIEALIGLLGVLVGSAITTGKEIWISRLQHRRSLPEPLMHRALALRNKARSTNRAISASSEHAFPPDYEEVFSARQKGYALLGLDALEVAEDLRKHYGIAVKSHVHFNTEWNAMVFLREKVAAFKEAA